MRTANNTNNYTVEGLVAKYRNFVKDSIADWQWELAKRACFTRYVDVDTNKGKAVLCIHLDDKPSAPYHIEWDTNGLMDKIIKTFEGCDSDKEFIDGLTDFCSCGEDECIKVYMDNLDASCRADYQLLAKLYCDYAQQNADSRIMRDMSIFSEAFKQVALYQEEYNFLYDHFAEVVSFEFSHEKDWFQTYEELYGVDSQTTKLLHWAIEYLKEKLTINSNQTVCAIGAGRGEIAQCFSQAEVLGFGDGGINWALGQIQTYAVIGKHSRIVPFKEFTMPEENTVDVITLDAVDMIGPWWGSSIDLQSYYKSLKRGGKMIIFATRYLTSGLHPRITTDGRNFVTRDEANFKDFIDMLVKEASIQSIVSTDMECHSSKWMHSSGDMDDIILFIEKKKHSTVFFQNLKNGKSATINADSLDSDLLWPSFYMTERPENGTPLSSLIKADLTIGEWAQQFGDSEEETSASIVEPSDLSENYKDASLYFKALNPLSSTNSYKYSVFSVPGVLAYCGNNTLVVGYQEKDHVRTIAVQDTIPYLVPVERIDPRYLAALMLQPEVKSQIINICDGVKDGLHFKSVLDRIIVPKHTPKERLQFLAEANYDALRSTKQELKKNHEDYKKAVRMRKHALTQSLSSIEAMFYSLNACRIRQNGKLENNDVISRLKGTTAKEAFEYIEPNLKNMMVTLEHIADVEYSFGNIEGINPEEFIEDYIAKYENGWLNFKPVVTWEKGHNLVANDVKDPKTGNIILRKGTPAHQLHFAKDALEHIFNNIISNAIAHGFTDKNRKDYQLRFSWYSDGLAVIVEIENNGIPIPSNRDTATLLEYGVSTALHKDGHNGIGCNEIDDIMRRYGGKVELVSTPNEEFTVKYILTFRS